MRWVSFIQALSDTTTTEESVDRGSDKISWAAGMLIVGKESSRSIQWFSTLSNGR